MRASNGHNLTATSDNGCSVKKSMVSPSEESKANVTADCKEILPI